MSNKTSWVDVHPDSHFTIYNFPFGIFSTPGSPRRAASAIGDYVIDLANLAKKGFFQTSEIPAEDFEERTLNTFIGRGKPKTRQVRDRLIEIFSADYPNLELHSNTLKEALIPINECTMHMPVRVPNYTDFYSSKEHATNVGTMFRDPDSALLPNWLHLPVGYHGRASSIIPSGIPVHRPKGQVKAPDATQPTFGPTSRLDFELEMAFITSTNTTLGDHVTTADAENHIFGFVLFNDWSARDIQVWEYVPLGPFLAKNFASSISPWVVTLEALEPFRVKGPSQDPAVLPYLEYDGEKNFDIQLQVGIRPENSTEKIVCNSNFRYMYWNAAQQLAHHTVNGCNLQVGDMYASGTISGPTKDSYGSMLELAWKGTKPVLMRDGSERKFINDGDTVRMTGYCQKNEISLGFGEVSTKILPAK